MDISVIVPCLNEVHEIPALLRVLHEAGRRFSGSWELLVVDGGSSDGTQALCESEEKIQLHSSQPSRAVQMNVGARNANGAILYFVHADTRPPLGCFQEIWSAHQQGAVIGGYSFEMDSASRLLAFNSYMTSFNIIFARGGDQSMFIAKPHFEQLGGFSESMKIMEEYDLLKRSKQVGSPFKLLKGSTIVSARKYEGRSWLRVQVANVSAMMMWRAGVDSSTIKRRYAKWLGKTT